MQQLPLDFGTEHAVDLRTRIQDLENVMLQMPLAQIEIPTKHYFAPGMYAREVTIPKDTTLTGKIHHFEHINIISKGDISVLTEDGVKRIQAPCTIISKPGTKRVGFAHEETVWTTIHEWHGEPDAVKAEAKLVCETHEQYEKILEEKKTLCLTQW